jgi:hypothetical protein
VDASGALSVTVRARTLAEARAAIDDGKAFAAVEIPRGTERDVLKGISTDVPIYADATYLFLFRSTSSGVSTPIGSLTSELVARGARSDGSPAKAKLASVNPADVLLQPVFNPVGGYAGYIVPAAFVRAGDIVARLSAIESTEQVDQARVALAEATASRNNAYAGVRREQIDSLKDEINKAKARLQYSEVQLTRATTLARENFETQQALDQAENDAAAARADVAEAQANYDAAVAGLTKEERAIADAQVQAAAAAVAVLESHLDKARASRWYGKRHCRRNRRERACRSADLRDRGGRQAMDVVQCTRRLPARPCHRRNG